MKEENVFQFVPLSKEELRNRKKAEAEEKSAVKRSKTKEGKEEIEKIKNYMGALHFPLRFIDSIKSIRATKDKTLYVVRIIETISHRQNQTIAPYPWRDEKFLTIFCVAVSRYGKITCKEILEFMDLEDWVRDDYCASPGGITVQQAFEKKLESFIKEVI